MKALCKNLFLFAIGGILYYLIEMIWRGHSHFSMFFVGGLCFILIGKINEYISWETPVYIQSILGSIITTTIEFISGCILNIWLGLDVWDYSNIPFNLLGQICLPFSVLWVFISFAAILLDDYIRYIFFGEEKPRYKWR